MRSTSATLVVAAVLVLGAGCASGSGSPPVPAPASAPGPTASAAPVDDDAASPETPDGPVLAFGATHVFADGNAVTVAAPVAGAPVAGAPFPRTLEVTVTVRNGTPVAEDLSRFGFDASVPGAPGATEDREAPAVEDGPSGALAPGEQRTFPLRFALPDPGPAEVTVEVAKADQTAPGQDVPGSDEAPGTVVDYEGLV
ncbi:hypothetical protein [Actinomycetospora sp. CA-053990]|uniref:hypothetical protein n=1 Tax=Actinomycetospora sp. CA-053990 TaxID=3239891 RepID=UPI003D8C03EC